jgi:hypothetical protein
MELLHRWAAVIWPQDGAAALLLLAACGVLAVGILRRHGGFARFVPSLMLVAVCELWPTSVTRRCPRGGRSGWPSASCS